MFTAARSLRAAAARSGNYAVRSIFVPLVQSSIHLLLGHSAVLDCEEHEHQTQWCVPSYHEYNFGLS